MADPIADLRELASAAPADDPRLVAYLAKVRLGAHAITDADVDELKDAGLTEDEIFEATTAAAIGEGLRRLDAAARVLG